MPADGVRLKELMKLLVLSDVHYASDAEKARAGHEARVIGNPLLRNAAHLWRTAIWLRNPCAHNHLLDAIVRQNPDPDLVIANGDFTIDSAFVGVSDSAALESARIAVEQLRGAYGDRFHGTIGDHDLGKMSLFGGAGGPRFASFEHCTTTLGLSPAWSLDFGVYRLLGLTSTLLALPVFRDEIIPAELPAWEVARERQLQFFGEAIGGLAPGRRLILFVHDPTALSFLRDEPAMQARMADVEATVIGHLHTPLILNLARRLAGIPRIQWMGVTARRYTTALREAACWNAFKVTLCPSPSGCQLLKDGGYLRAELDPSGVNPVRFERVRLPWTRA